MSWPSSNDPFYLANTVDNNARRSYYIVNATPTMKCDGSTASWPSIASAINARLAVASHLWLDLDASVNGSNLEVACTAVADMDISGNVVIQMALLDRYSYLPNSPNGQPNHYHALHAFAPSSSGQVFSATAFDTVHYYSTFVLDPSWGVENLDIACFVQNNNTKEILQAHCEQVPIDYPNIILTDYAVSDPTGNGDGRVDPDETGEMVVTLQNQIPFHDAEQVVATLSTDEPQIDVTVSTVNFPDLPSGASASNDGDPFEFYVDPSFEAHNVTFTVTVTAEPQSFTAQYPVTFMVGRPDILLVNDDIMGNYQTFYEEPLDQLDLPHDSWNQVQNGFIPESEMNLYSVIIWYTGDDATSVLSPDEQQKLQDFLNTGGRLFLSSQNAGDVLGSTSFYEDVLHAQHLVNATGEFMLNGVPGDPISEGTTALLAGSGGAGNATSCSSLDVIPPAVGIYNYQIAGSLGALRCESQGYRLVYFAFPFEAITGAAGTTPRVEVLENVLAWLQAEVAVPPETKAPTLPERFELTGITPNPFNPLTEISFSLPRSGLVELNIYNLQGELVREVISSLLEAGYHRISWHAASLCSGVYILALSANGQTSTAKAVLLK